jgi:hypothetical protein
MPTFLLTMQNSLPVVDQTLPDPDSSAILFRVFILVNLLFESEIKLEVIEPRDSWIYTFGN